METWLNELQLSRAERDLVLRAVTTSPSLALAFVDAGGVIRFANDAFALLTGLSKQALLGAALQDILAFEVVDKLLAEAATGTAAVQALELAWADGGTRHVGGALSKVPLSERHVYMLTLRDDTERRDAVDRFYSLYAHLSHGVLLFDESTMRCEDANDAALRMLRYPNLRAIQGLTPWDFTVNLGKANEVVDAVLRAAPAALQIPVEKVRRRDGSQFPAMLSLGWFDSLGGRKVFAILEDLTARVRDERRLRRLLRLRRLATSCSQRSARAATETELYTGICEELVGERTFTGAWIASLGQGDACNARPIAVAGESLTEEQLYAVMRDLGASLGVVCASLRGGQRHVGRDHPDDASFVPWRAIPDLGAIAMLPVRLGEAVPLMLVVHANAPDAFDGDELGLLEELCSDVAFAVQRLKLEARHRELGSLLRQSQKMEAIGTLAGGIAHDFNNLLASISGNLYLAQQGAIADPVARERLRQAEDTCFRAGERISQLLIFARKGVVRREAKDLVGLLRQSASMFELTIPKNIDLRLRLPEDTELIAEVDGVQVQQLVLNLLANARDAVEAVSQPRVSVRLSAAEPDAAWRTRHTTCGGERFAMLQVADNGCGIAEEHVDQVFEPFFTTKDVGRGTGLGLAMVYGAVQEHGGAVEIASIVNEGTTVTVWFPVTEQALRASPSEPVAVPVEPVATKLGVLVVDDDIMVRQVQVELLRAMGFATFSASNGAEALQVYRTHADAIDAVVMDVIMPVLGGVAAARRLRELRPELPILFASGHDEQHTLADVGDMQRIAIVTKPVRARALAARIRELVG